MIEPEVLGSMIDVIRGKLGRQIEALAAEIDATQRFSPELAALLREIGIFGAPFDVEDGGLGASYVQFTRLIEELSGVAAIAASYVGVTVQVTRALMRFGNPKQKALFGADLVSGRVLGAWGFTEPQTGSDPKEIRTVAKREGSEWLLNGSKMFISYAGEAGVALVFAKTSEARLGAFLVRLPTPGWIVSQPFRVMSLGGQGTAAITIDNVRLPEEALLGEADKGFDLMLAGEAEGKVRAAAQCVGIARRALLEATRYATERTHRGASIGSKFPTIQSLLGEMSSRVDAAHSLAQFAAASLDERSPLGHRRAASARIVCAEAARETTSRALQVCGAYGLTKEMIVERLYREGKFFEVGQGVIELQKIIVGKQCLLEYEANRSLS
ncbi:MAG: acyl-CoA dehydrogenase family protein [Hyphomicrobiaceae bacterium]